MTESTTAPIRLYMSMSLDGFIAGPDDRPGQELGRDGGRLFNWMDDRMSDGPNGQVYFMGNITPRSANGLPPLRFTAVSVTNGVTSLAWETIPAQTYRLQYRTNLADVNWTDLAPDILASNKVVQIVAPMSPDSQRFYRVRWVE